MKWLFSLGKTCWLVRKISYCHNLCHSCYQVTCIIQIYTVVTKNLRKSVEVSYSLFCHMVSDVSFQSWLPSTTVSGPGMKCSVLQGVHGDTKFLLSRQSGRVREWKREGRKGKGGKRMEVEGREEREGRREALSGKRTLWKYTDWTSLLLVIFQASPGPDSFIGTCMTPSLWFS